MSAEYSSNCPVSRPSSLGLSEDADLGGMSWNNERGLFYATENDLLPIKLPPMPPSRDGS